jgi:predicted protein tyrosine phosphatase
MCFMIYVCGLRGVVTAAGHVQPRHIISITDPGTPAPVVAGLLPGCHLMLEFHDIGLPQDGLVAPQQEHIEQILTFAARWDRQHPLLVHCHAGVSRSMATAVIVHALNARGREAEVVRLLRSRAPHAHPNRRMIALADALLACDGRLIAAVETMGPATSVDQEGPLVHFWLEP